MQRRIIWQIRDLQLKLHHSKRTRPDVEIAIIRLQKELISNSSWATAKRGPKQRLNAIERYI